jgi:hypothetical protein
MGTQAITNVTSGPRLLTVVIDDQAKLIVLQPGETRDLVLFQPDHPATKAMFDIKELLAGPAGTQPLTEAEQHEIYTAFWKAEVIAAYGRGSAEATRAKGQGPRAKGMDGVYGNE